MEKNAHSALDRFQQFIARFGPDDIVDQESGFSAADAELLANEVATALIMEERARH